MEMESRTRLVRRHWSFVLAYSVVAALVVGFGLMLIVMFLPASRDPRVRITIHMRLVFYLISASVVSFAIFVIQVLTGPLVFTCNVVCKTCCRPRKLYRSPFFAIRGRLPKCEDCGGELEAGIFWKEERVEIDV